MKVRVHLHNTKYKTKPDEDKVGTISNQISKKQTSINIEDLAKELCNGRTVLFGIMNSNGIRNKFNVNHQEVVALDFDTEEDMSIINNEFIQDNASFYYYTFSHELNEPRFRVVFVLDEPLNHYFEITQVYEYLLNLFPTADKNCKDPSRLFFGGNNYKEINFNNTMSVKGLIDYSLKDTYIEELPTYDLIRYHKDDLVKMRIGNTYKASVYSRTKAMEYLYRVDMRKVLGLPNKSNIHDILGYDRNPSVNVWKTESGVWLYTRMYKDRESKTRNIIQVIQKLRGVNMGGAIDYLIYILGIDFNVSDKVRIFNEEIEEFSNTLLSENLNLTYPQVAKIFKDGRSMYASDVVSILKIMQNNVIEIDGEIRFVTDLSYREISNRIYGHEGKKDRIANVVNLMATTDWIKKLGSSEIPDNMLEYLLGHQETKKNKYRKTVLEYKGKNKDTFFEILEQQCRVMVENNYTTASLSREGLANLLNEDKAKEVYNQSEFPESKEIESDIIQYIMKEVNDKGYCLEKDIIIYFDNNSKYSRSYLEKFMKRYRNKFSKGYDLKFSRLNKNVKKELGLLDTFNSNQTPNAYYK